MEITSKSNSCPKCLFVYEHRTKVPDICTECGEVLNDKDLSKVFAVPDYLHYQLGELHDKAVLAAKPLASEEGYEGVNTEEFVNKMDRHLEGELKTFINTCSFPTIEACFTDTIMQLQHLPQNVNLKRAEFKKLAEMAKMIGEYGKIYEFYSRGGALNYEYRTKTAEASELGAGSRDTIDTDEKGS